MHAMKKLMIFIHKAENVKSLIIGVNYFRKTLHRRCLTGF